MSLLPNASLDDVIAGNVPGWALVFYGADATGGPAIDGAPSLTVTDDQYHADLQATLPSGLEGGTYSFELRGVTEADYVTLRAAKAVRLYLFWRDVNSTVAGYFANVLDSLTGILDLAVKDGAPEEGLVAELAVTGVKRKPDGLQYVTEVKAKERVFHLLRGRMCGPLDSADPFTAAENIVIDKVDFEPHRPDQVQELEGEDPEDPAVETDQLNRDVLRNLETRMREAGSVPGAGMYGRPVYLIRDGQLHIGRRDPDDEDVIDLTARGGLLHVEKSGIVSKDPNAPRCVGGQEVSPPESRAQYTLILKGRPDIKPGSVVRFGAPPAEEKTPTEEFNAPGNLGGITDYFAGDFLPSVSDEIDPEVFMLVNSVEHKLGATTGFVTTVVGVTGSPGDWWDHYSPPPEDEEAEDADGDASPEGRAARAVRQQVRRHANAHRFPEAGEVRRHTPTGTGEPPAQTLLVWRGLAPADGRPNGSRRLDVRREDPHRVPGIPYVTPFAWGKCGLVLPYYPGMRTLMAHRNGREEDAVALGAVWASGQGPSGAEAGDWWLSLPTEVPEAERETLDDAAEPDPYAGKVSHDLIDAEGNRIIEVGELTIRIGRDVLRDAGERPPRADDADSVTIEHADGGSRLVMKSDGSILIEGTSIEMTATDGDINLSATNVNVSVQGAMDVS